MEFCINRSEVVDSIIRNANCNQTIDGRTKCVTEANIRAYSNEKYKFFSVCLSGIYIKTNLN